MSPFNRAHTTSYSTLIETMRLSCTVFEIRSAICRKSPILTHPTCIWRPRSRAGSVSFFKVGIGFRFFGRFFQKSVSVSVSVFQNIAISVSVFPHEPTIAYRISPSLKPYALPFPPNGVWGLGPRICITNCGHKR